MKDLLKFIVDKIFPYIFVFTLGYLIGNEVTIVGLQKELIKKHFAEYNRETGALQYRNMEDIIITESIPPKTLEHNK